MGGFGPGLYEALVTRALRARLDGSGLRARLEALDPGEAHLFLARHLHDLLLRVLDSVPAERRVDAQIDVCNRVLDLLAGAVPRFGLSDGDHVEPELLLALTAPGALVGEAAPERPGIPLSQSDLLVNARGEHRIGVELARELASADAADLLLSFLKWSGYAQLRAALRGLRDRGRPLRVLTTVYMGATERRVLDELHAMGASVRVSYDTERTRLHAKAWLFHRDSGYSTAYIGSSNLSAAALTAGLEWNVRLSAVDAPHVLAKFRAAFENYWHSEDFEPYDPVRDAGRFDRAVRRERADDGGVIAALDVRPRPFQQVLLDRLRAEREVHGRHRNLVVAATGTGKTVMAALDYRRECDRAGSRLPLLFVAHQERLLDQSRAVFRQVMRDGHFGEKYVGGARPSEGRHVFASVQSLNHVALGELPPRQWAYVVVDEFHHAEAPTYRRLLEHLQPDFLLGLTATPERADGQDVLHWFGGRVAAELRLWEAIDQGFLCPFQYFGVSDDVDVARAWKRGRYDVELLEEIYTGHHGRAHLVAQAVADHVADLKRMRALGFCAGVAHATFMARRFAEDGIPAEAVTGKTSQEERERAIGRLRDGVVKVLFTADLFNEGVDIPEVNTVLFLRPTESPTVFLQQLGRGLRHAEGKDALTVLDFIGPTDRAYRFDRRYRALCGGTRRQVTEWAAQGFPVLPAGCAIDLDETSQRRVLESLKQAIGARQETLVRELAELGDVDLPTFLRETGVELSDLYRNGRTFTALRRAAGLPTAPPAPEEAEIGRGLGRLLHVDDLGRLEAWRALLDGAPAADRRAAMLAAVVTDARAERTTEEALAALLRIEALRRELRDLLGILGDGIEHTVAPFTEVPAVPLAVHGTYRQQEVMAAFDARTERGALYLPREGVWFDERTRCDVFFVTLQKAEKDYSPTTMYDDYALSTDEFHWQSQSRTTRFSKAGRRHVEHREQGITPLLFVRERRRDDRGETAPYVFLGPADLASWTGERPMSIVWRLRHPMRAALYEEMRVAG